MENDYSIAQGTIVHGGKNDYNILSCIRRDGMGYTYLGEPLHKLKGFTEKVIIREHFMPHCSTRGVDGLSVETPDEIKSTVDTCLQAFEQASEERAIISHKCTSIINVLDNFEANNTFYYVVEFLDGITFEDYVKQRGSLSFEEAREMLAPILDAVRIMHTRHALHTEIHPRHIRFAKYKGQDIPVLYSLYATLHFNDEVKHSWAVQVMNCKTGYAPPEQYHSIDHFSPQTDIYALAATIVFALSGKNLPDSRTITEEEIRNTLPPALPETTVQALIHALSPDIAHRTSSISALRSELLDFYGGLRRDTEPETKEYHYTWKSRLSHYGIPLMIAAIAVILGLFVALI